MEILDHIGTFCIQNKETIAVAESVTSGCIQTLISNAKNAEKFFQGGITVYNTAQKTRHLQVEPICAEDCNAVSKEIAVTMAIEVSRQFCSSFGLATTGYAAPYPERNIKTPFAYLAVVHKGQILFAGKIVATSLEFGLPVQKEYANTILEILSEKMTTLQ